MTRPATTGFAALAAALAIGAGGGVAGYSLADRGNASAADGSAAAATAQPTANATPPHAVPSLYPGELASAAPKTWRAVLTPKNIHMQKSPSQVKN